MVHDNDTNTLLIMKQNETYENEQYNPTECGDRQQQNFNTSIDNNSIDERVTFPPNNTLSSTTKRVDSNQLLNNMESGANDYIHCTNRYDLVQKLPTTMLSYTHNQGTGNHPLATCRQSNPLTEIMAINSKIQSLQSEIEPYCDEHNNERQIDPIRITKNPIYSSSSSASSSSITSLILPLLKSFIMISSNNNTNRLMDNDKFNDGDKSHVEYGDNCGRDDISNNYTSPVDHNQNNNNNNETSTHNNSPCNERNENRDVFDSVFRFRSLRPRDRIPIQALHEEWFPVRYQDEFYDDLVHNKFHNSNEPLYTCLITELVVAKTKSSSPHMALQQIPWQQSVQYNASNTTTQRFRTVALRDSLCSSIVNEDIDRNDTYNDIDRNDTCESNNNKIDTIVACVVGSFLHLNQVSSMTRQLLISNPKRHTYLFYIMTLGTCQNYRHFGFGTALIEKCINHANNHNYCGVIYLHVIVTNHAAIRFYEKLGFYRVTEIADYYTINQQQFNCYLYAKYLNGTFRDFGGSVRGK
jgi:ribosomal protein S18 acetylase RimI-like enzyme